MKSRTVMISAVIHAGVATALLFAAEQRQLHRRSTAVSLGEEKKKEKPKEDKPKPVIEKPAAPKPVVHKSAPEPARPVGQAPPPSKSSAPAPVDTGLTLGDSDGPGIDIGGPARTGPAPVKTTRQDDNQAGPKRPAPAPRKKDQPKPEDECTEEPTRPEPISKTEIEYTQSARAAGIEGRLVIRVTIDKDGGVAKAEIVHGLDAQLDAAAIAAVEHWRFKPSLRCGKPVFGGVYTLARRFELGD